MGNNPSSVDKRERDECKESCLCSDDKCVCERDQQSILLGQLKSLNLDDGSKGEMITEPYLVGGKTNHAVRDRAMQKDKEFVHMSTFHTDVLLAKNQGYLMHCILTEEELKLCREQTALKAVDSPDVVGAGDYTPEELEDFVEKRFKRRQEAKKTLKEREKILGKKKQTRNDLDAIEILNADIKNRKREWSETKEKLIKGLRKAEMFSHACAKAMTLELVVRKGDISHFTEGSSWITSDNVPSDAVSRSNFFEAYYNDCDAWIFDPEGVPPWLETCTVKVEDVEKEVAIFPALIGGPEAAGDTFQTFLERNEDYDFFPRIGQSTQTEVVDDYELVPGRGRYALKNLFKGTVFEAIEWFQDYQLMMEEQYALLPEDPEKKVRFRTVKIPVIDAVLNETIPIGCVENHYYNTALAGDDKVAVANEYLRLLEREAGLHTPKFLTAQVSTGENSLEKKGRMDSILVCYGARLNYLNRILCTLRMRGPKETEKVLLKNKIKFGMPPDTDKEIREARLEQVLAHLKYGREVCLKQLAEMLPKRFRACRLFSVLSEKDPTPLGQYAAYARKRVELSTTSVVNPTVHFITLMAMTTASVGTCNMKINFNLPDMSEVAALLFNQSGIDMRSLARVWSGGMEISGNYEQFVNLTFGTSNWSRAFQHPNFEVPDIIYFHEEKIFKFRSLYRFNNAIVVNATERDKQLFSQNVGVHSNFAFSAENKTQSFSGPNHLAGNRRPPASSSPWVLYPGDPHKCSVLNFPSLGSKSGISNFLTTLPVENSFWQLEYPEGVAIGTGDKGVLGLNLAKRFVAVDPSKFFISVLMPAWHLLSGDFLERGEDEVHHTLYSHQDLVAEHHASFYMGTSKRLALVERSLDMNAYLPLMSRFTEDPAKRYSFFLETDKGVSVSRSPMLMAPLAAYLSITNVNVEPGETGGYCFSSSPRVDDLFGGLRHLRKFFDCEEFIEAIISGGVKAIVIESMATHYDDPLKNSWLKFLFRSDDDYYSVNGRNLDIPDSGNHGEHIYSTENLRMKPLEFDPKLDILLAETARSQDDISVEMRVYQRDQTGEHSPEVNGIPHPDINEHLSQMWDSQHFLSDVLTVTHQEEGVLEGLIPLDNQAANDEMFVEGEEEASGEEEDEEDEEDSRKMIDALIAQQEREYEEFEFGLTPRGETQGAIPRSELSEQGSRSSVSTPMFFNPQRDHGISGELFGSPESSRFTPEPQSKRQKPADSNDDDH